MGRPPGNGRHLAIGFAILHPDPGNLRRFPAAEQSIFILPGARLRQAYPTDARNDQRNRSFWNVDLQATKEIRVARRLNLRISAEVFNVLNDGTFQIYNPFFEAGQRINGVNEAQRRFGRRWQVGMKVSF